jgi:hypothetical protein
MNSANALIEIASFIVTATKTASCVARSPTGLSASSYVRVTARAAARAL